LKITDQGHRDFPLTEVARARFGNACTQRAIKRDAHTPGQSIRASFGVVRIPFASTTKCTHRIAATIQRLACSSQSVRSYSSNFSAVIWQSFEDFEAAREFHRWDVAHLLQQ